MGETGSVISLNGNMAQVKLRRSAACEKCGACIRLNPDGEDMLIAAFNASGAKPGDKVVIDVPVSGFVKASALMYALPCALFILGLFFGNAIGSDTAGLITGAALVAGVYIFVRKKGHIFRKKEYMPIVTEVVASELPAHNEDTKLTHR